MAQQDDEHNHKHLKDRGILLLEIGIGTGANGGGDFLHSFGTLGVAQDPLGLHPREQSRDQRANESYPEQIFHDFLSLRWFYAFVDLIILAYVLFFSSNGFPLLLQAYENFSFYIK